MARCYVTGKTTVTGNKRSHALNATRRTWKANLQKVIKLQRPAMYNRVKQGKEGIVCERINIYRKAQETEAGLENHEISPKGGAYMDIL